MESNYLRKKVKNIAFGLNVSWEMFIISEFDEAANLLKSVIDEINEIADYSIENRLNVNLDSNKISYLLKKINNHLENHQFVEAADILKYKLLRNFQLDQKSN
ncbi:hypothetical protein ACJDT4_14550 [Clostridium neuense]|uniref:Uncharacterized protein n=1 Tax=Clostridium neuense TaxID=1728934 RepID=A0ABW8THX1_9CLOT